MCHGWAPAAYAYVQPRPVNVSNSDGLLVPFGSSDVKALLTYFVAMYEDGVGQTAFIGQRCNYDLAKQPHLANRSACADWNAGSFHVALANRLARADGGFVVDRDRSVMVWNQPVYAWSTKCARAGNATAPTACTTDMVYGKETAPAWEAHDPLLIREQYSYTLQLDSAGRVTGGDYTDKSAAAERVDFAWSLTVSNFTGYFKASSVVRDVCALC